MQIQYSQGSLQRINSVLTHSRDRVASRRSKYARNKSYLERYSPARDLSQSIDSDTMDCLQLQDYSLASGESNLQMQRKQRASLALFHNLSLQKLGRRK